MEITCPEHGGIIYVPGNDSLSTSETAKTLVIACPVCDEEVLISGADNSEERRATNS